MDLPKAPCEVKDVILFDAEKLKQFLHFIEASNLKAHTEINALKTKVQEINELRRDIKEVNVKLNFQSQRIDAAEESLKFHQKRFLEIDQVINRFQEVKSSKISRGLEHWKLIKMK